MQQAVRGEERRLGSIQSFLAGAANGASPPAASRGSVKSRMWQVLGMEIGKCGLQGNAARKEKYVLELGKQYKNKQGKMARARNRMWDLMCGVLKRVISLSPAFRPVFASESNLCK